MDVFFFSNIWGNDWISFICLTRFVFVSLRVKSWELPKKTQRVAGFPGFFQGKNLGHPKYSGQIIRTSSRRLVTPNGGLGSGNSPQNDLNSGLGIIVICPDIYIYMFVVKPRFFVVKLAQRSGWMTCFGCFFLATRSKWFLFPENVWKPDDRKWENDEGLFHHIPTHWDGFIRNLAIHWIFMQG